MNHIRRQRNVILIIPFIILVSSMLYYKFIILGLRIDLPPLSADCCRKTYIRKKPLQAESMYDIIRKTVPSVLSVLWSRMDGVKQSMLSTHDISPRGSGKMKNGQRRRNDSGKRAN